MTRRDADYDLLFAGLAVAGLAIVPILLIVHAAKPPKRTATEQAAIEWGQEHLATKQVYALCEDSYCAVWGVRSWVHSHNAATPAISLDCSTHPCTMVKP